MWTVYVKYQKRKQQQAIRADKFFQRKIIPR